MPLKSKRQNRWMHAAESRGELPKGTAHRWAHETPGGVRNLPERAKKKRGVKRGKRRNKRYTGRGRGHSSR